MPFYNPDGSLMTQEEEEVFLSKAKKIIKKYKHKLLISNPVKYAEFVKYEKERNEYIEKARINAENEKLPPTKPGKHNPSPEKIKEDRRILFESLEKERQDLLCKVKKAFTKDLSDEIELELLGFLKIEDVWSRRIRVAPIFSSNLMPGCLCPADYCGIPFDTYQQVHDFLKYEHAVADVKFLSCSELPSILDKMGRDGRELSKQFKNLKTHFVIAKVNEEGKLVFVADPRNNIYRIKIDNFAQSLEGLLNKNKTKRYNLQEEKDK